MVKIINLLLLIIILSIFSCDFFQATPFDMSESLLLISNNISYDIPGSISYYQFNTLKNDNEEYLFLYMEQYYGSQIQRVVILDKYLKVKEVYDDDNFIFDLGRLSMVDANGNFVVGNTVLNNDLVPINNTSLAGVNADSFGVSNDEIGINYIFEMNNSNVPALPADLMFDIYDLNWNGIGGSSFEIGINIGNAPPYEIIKITYDNDNSNISFIFEESYYDTYYSVLINKDFFPGNVLVSNLLDYYSTISFSDLESESICFTSSGITGVRNNSELRLVSVVSSNTTIDEYEDWDKEDFYYAYDVNGDYFYYFNPDNKNIFKSYKWWKE